MSTVNTSISPAEIPKVVQQEGRTHLGTLCCTSVRLCSFEAHRKGPSRRLLVFLGNLELPSR